MRVTSAGSIDSDAQRFPVPEIVVTPVRQLVSRGNVPALAVYVAVVLTVGMLLFPPYTGVRGLEYAYVLTGPALSQGMSDLARQLGLGARIDWAALAVQLGVVWSIALGVRRALLAGMRAVPDDRAGVPVRTVAR